MDIGLVNHYNQIELVKLDDLVTANEGTLAEQFIGQEYRWFTFRPTGMMQRQQDLTIAKSMSSWQSAAIKEIFE